MADLDGIGTLDQKIWDAILSMDSYHRGYGEKVLNLPEVVGTYTIKTDSLNLFPEIRSLDAYTAGFYAVTYTDGVNDVVAYRGTDDAADIAFGWSVGAGVHSLGTQDALKYALNLVFDKVDFGGLAKALLDAVSKQIGDIGTTRFDIERAIVPGQDAATAAAAAANVIGGMVNPDAIRGVLTSTFRAFLETYFDEKAQAAIKEAADLIQVPELGEELRAEWKEYTKSEEYKEIVTFFVNEYDFLTKEALATDTLKTYFADKKAEVTASVTARLTPLYETVTDEVGREALAKDEYSALHPLTGTIPYIEDLIEPLADLTKGAADFADAIAKFVTENELVKGSIFDRQFSQGALAVEYHKLEGGTDRVVGHSLGGGLAQMVSAVAKTEGAAGTIVEGSGFDAMPGLLAAAHHVGVNTDFSVFQALIWPHIFEQPVRDIVAKLDLTTLDLYHVDGEVLETVREGDVHKGLVALSAAGGAVAAWYGKWDAAEWGYYIFDLALESGAYTTALSNVNPSETVNPHLTSFSNPLNLHDIGYLTILSYGETIGSGQYWTELGDNLYDALFDERTALAAGYGDSEHTVDGLHVSTMTKAIAYSAIDTGGLVFGNTGIRALFDDLNELGYLKAEGELPDGLQGSETALAGAAVQFAAQMALQEVDFTAHSAEGEIPPTEGILSFLDDDLARVSPDEADLVELDLSEALWKLRDGAGEEAPDAIDVPLLWDYLAQKFSVYRSTTEAIMTLLYGSNEIGTIEKWAWQIAPGGITLELPLRDADPTHHDPGIARYFASTDGDDTIYAQFENDVIMTGGGKDVVWGGLGNDYISTMDGSDWIVDQITLMPPDGMPTSGPETDVYLGDGALLKSGDNLLENLALHFVGWLRSKTQTDVVKYTLQTDRTDPNTLEGGGLTVNDLSVQKLGDNEMINISLTPEDSEKRSDLLQGINQVHLSEKGDRITVTDTIRNVPIWIDLADPGGGDGAIYTKADWDEVDYSSLHRIGLINGSTRSLSFDNPELSGGVGTIGLIASMLFDVPPNAEVVLRSWVDNDPLRVSGAEIVRMTSADDVVWYGDLGDIAGWVNGTDYQRHGDLFMGDGNDIAYVWNPEYIFEGQKVGNAEGLPEPLGHHATAGEDMRLTIRGEDGDDVLIVRGGKGAIIEGGLGRDVLYNSSYKGQIYGGTVDGEGAGETDIFWFAPGAFIMDAEKVDLLQMFGIPLTGGTNSLMGFEAYSTTVAYDYTAPFVYYTTTTSGQLVVSSMVHGLFGGGDLLDYSMIVEDFTFGELYDTTFGLTEKSDLNMLFRMIGVEGAVEISSFMSIFGQIAFTLKKLLIWAKAWSWSVADDPLVLDLDGDGLETVSLSQSGAFFDLDGDDFAQKTGWLSGDDGFLVIDIDGDGKIRNIDEMFGQPGGSGFAELAAFDDTGDGIVDAADARFDELLIWRDLNGSGTTEAGELFTLADLGIVSIGATGIATDRETPQGHLLREESVFTRDDGTTGTVYEIIFETDPSRTRFTGDRGLADFAATGAAGTPVNAMGRGLLADLAVNASNDLAVNEAVATAIAAMDVPDLDLLREQARPVLGAWARSIEQSLELTPLRVTLIDGVAQVTDHAIWVEDATGGRFELASGGMLTDSGGNPITNPTLADFAAADGWRIEQMFSPSDRRAAVGERTERPYLVEIVDGRAVVLDWGEQVTDATGSYWRLASGAAVLDGDGNMIARPTLADIRAQSRDAAQEWRVEEFGHDPFEGLPFDMMAVYMIDGEVTDYSVWVEDAEGGFHIWARNLDRALELQFKEGRAGGFGLRGYEIDFDALDEADSSTDSYYRAEILTIDEFRFALASYGVEFRPEILYTTVDPETGMLVYETGGFGADEGGTPLPDDRYVSIVEPAIGFFDQLMESYIAFSRANAVRLAAQGELAGYFDGIAYNAATDLWEPVGGREFVPMLEAILTGAPADADSAYDWLTGWQEILEAIYPDYQTNADDALDQKYLFHQVVAAWENVPGVLGLVATAERLGIDEELVLTYDPVETVVNGTARGDLIYISGTDTTIRGGLGGDTYVVGRIFDGTVIEDVESPLDPRNADFLRFAHLTADEILAEKDGIDLVITEIATGQQLRVKAQFEGQLLGLFGRDWTNDTEMVKIHFADGEAWTVYDLAFATSHPKDSDDIVMGTPTIDVLEGGKGDDIMRGGREGDTYVIRLGDGVDRIEDDNDQIFITAHDMVYFGDGISQDGLRFVRNGPSDDLEIVFLDEDGAETGQRLTIEGQFKAVNTWMLGVYWQDRIERLVFRDQSFLDEAQIMDQVLEQAGTDAADVIFGFYNEDRLDGGLGDDVLSGGDLGDTYLYAAGGGYDVIEDNMSDFLSPSYDVLDIAGYGAADFTFERIGASATVTMRVDGTDDAITLANQFELTSTVLFGDYYYDNIDEIRFGDGGVWDMGTLARVLIEQQQTDGDDVIYGFDMRDTLDGGAGNDRLEGGVYSDTYIFAPGYGHDVIFDDSRHPLLAPGWDRLEMRGIGFDDVVISRAADDLTFTLKSTGESVMLEGQYNRLGGQENAIEELVFADRTVLYTDLNPEDVDLIGTNAGETLIGTHFAETIDGRGGDDLLIGSSDGDTYLFDAGYGHDVIRDVVSAGWYGTDTVRFGDDISRETVIFVKDGDDLLITLTDRPDTLTVEGQFTDVLTGVERFVFADGTEMAISDVEELLAIAGGNRGDNLIEGLPDRENVLDGRQGDDRLIGGAHSDSYAFGTGYDLDRIEEFTEAASVPGAVDRVVFGALVTIDAVEISRDGDDLLFTLPLSGDQLRIVDGLGARQVERFLFGDGTELGIDEIRSLMLVGSSGDDELRGFDGRDDLLDGGTGSDLLMGEGGNDTYVFELGDGADAILETGGTDRVTFGARITLEAVTLFADDDNLVFRFLGTDDSLAVIGALASAAARVEEFVFGDGMVMSFDQALQVLVDAQQSGTDDVVTGFGWRGDMISGGEGHDLLIGLGGSDHYDYAAGDGFDIVEDAGASSGDRLVFADYIAAEADFRRASPDSSDLMIDFGGGDRVMIVDGLAAGGRSTLEEVEWGDGSIWTHADFRREVLANAGTDPDADRPDATDLEALALLGGEAARDDLIAGFDGDDRVAGGLGDDEIDLRQGNDTYVFRRGDGRDLIDDTGGSGDTDVLQIRGYTPEQVTVLRPYEDRDDLLLLFEDSDDEVLLVGQYEDAAGRGIEQVAFSDGTIWDRAFLVDNISTAGSDDDDIITGSSGAETLIGAGGDDYLSGGDGSDTYVFRRGDGYDVIDDNGQYDTDIVVLEGILPGDAILSQAFGDATTLVIDFKGGGDRLTILNTLEGAREDQIEELHFADGTVWTMQDVRERLVAQNATDGDDEIIGFNTDETFHPGRGDDYIQGEDGADIYVFDAGDGHDVIRDQGYYDTDVLRLRGIAPEDVSLSPLRNDRTSLTINMPGSDRVDLLNTLTGNTNDQIEHIEFDDGTIWTMADVRTMMVDAQNAAGLQKITGFISADVLLAGAGTPYLSGLDGSDTYVITPASGQVTIQDNGYYDTDVIHLPDFNPDEVTFAIGDGDWADLLIEFDPKNGQAVSDNLSVLVRNTLIWSGDETIERIRFGDGSEIDMDVVRAEIVAAQQTDGDDYLRGFKGSDLMAGGAGDDTLTGQDGSDTYVFNRGDGRDTIDDNGYHDTDVVQIIGYDAAEAVLGTVRFHQEDLVLSFATGDSLRIRNTLTGAAEDQIERIDFLSVPGTDPTTSWDMSTIRQMLVSQQATAGDDTVQGTSYADILDGGAGNDTLVGRDGSDTYHYAAGAGHDTVRDDGYRDTDVIEISGVLSADVTAATDPYNVGDLILTFAGFDGSLTIHGGLDGSDAYEIEQYHFDDGTIWTPDDFAAMVTPVARVEREGTSGGDTFVGTAEDEIFRGYGGNDRYEYTRGGGYDWILSEEGTWYGTQDTLALVGILPEEVRVERRSNAATVIVSESAPGAGDGGQIRMEQMYDRWFERGLEYITFETVDGTVTETWNVATLMSLWLDPQFTDGDDDISGAGGGETYMGGLGDDYINGGSGNDTYIWAPGDGNDMLVEDSNRGTDRLELRSVATDEVTVLRDGSMLVLAIAAAGAEAATLYLPASLDTSWNSGIETIAFDDGTEWGTADVQAIWRNGQLTDGDDSYYGFGWSETIDAGPGDDRLAGASGNDTYVWRRGDGNDTFYETTNQGTDTLRLPDVMPEDVSLEIVGADVHLTIADTAEGAGGTLTLHNGYAATWSSGIEKIVFGDDTEWTQTDLRYMYFDSLGTAGDDDIYGTGLNEPIEGRGGDDYIAGGSGDDTYVWRHGDGHDVIVDGSNQGGGDRVYLPDTDVDQVSVARSGNTAILIIAESAPGAGDGGSLDLRSTLNSSWSSGVETVEFADGTEWSQADLSARLLEYLNRDTAELVEAFSGADVLEGGGGDDLLRGMDGTDTYRWAPGDGDDTIEDSYVDDIDTLVLAGVTPSDVRLSEGTDGALMVHVAATDSGPAARITLIDSYDAAGRYGIDRILFEDTGTEWLRADFAAVALETAGTPRDDRITGSVSGDRIEALAGNDRVEGREGDDTYVFRAGDGRDVYRDNGDGTDTIEISGYDDADVLFQRLGAGSDDLILRFVRSADAITVLNGLSGTGADSIERVLLTDSGTEVSLAEITARILLDRATDAADVIGGTADADRLTGAGGSDSLDGRDGDDSYLFHLGDGDDRIEDSGTDSGDVLEIIGLSEADLTAIRRSPPDGVDLILVFASGDRVTLVDALDDTSSGVETIRFEDGTEWGLAELRAMTMDSAGTSGDDGIWGFSSPDILRGNLGADALFGREGGDTYVYARGDGADTIEDNGSAEGTDALVLTDYTEAETSVQRFYRGDDGILLTFAGNPGDRIVILNTLSGSDADTIEEIRFADGAVWSMVRVADLLDNNAPTALQDGFFSVVEAVPSVILTEDLLRNDFDADGEALTVISVSNPSTGTVALDGDGNVVFTGAPGVTGVASFDYTVSDGRSGMATATVFLRVRPPATALDDSGFTVEEDGLLTISADRLLSNDIDGDRMILAEVFGAVGGLVSLSSAGEVSFTPTADHTGPASFHYAANTPEGGRAEALVSIDVTPVNDAPEARNDTGFAMDEGATLLIDGAALLANDTDIDGDTLTLTSVSPGENIVATLRADGQVFLAPTPYFFGTAAFTYTIADPDGATATATATVSVAPVNSDPVPTDDTFFATEDVPLTLTAAELLANDLEYDGDPLTLLRVTNGPGASAQLFENGTILVTPTANFEGMAQFGYVVGDGQGSEVAARVRIQVDPVNDAPEARNDHYADVDFLSGEQNAPLVIDPADLLANDSDIDSPEITLASVSNGAHGDVELREDGMIVFTPDPDHFFEASFRYVVADGAGGVDDAQAVLWFEPLMNAPPYARDDIVTMFEDVDTAIPVATLLANDLDVDGAPLRIESLFVLPHTGITVEMTETGEVLIRPDLNYNGGTFFDYVVTDDEDGTDTGRVHVSITAVNDAPTAAPDVATTTLDAPLVVRIADIMANDSDVDVDEAHYASELNFAGAVPSVGDLWTFEDEFLVVEMPAGYAGPANLTYTIADSAGVTDDGTVVAAVSDTRAEVIEGSALRDLLIGTAWGETFRAGDGDDVIHARDGDDVVEASEGADTLDGGDGIDRIDYAASEVGIRVDLVSRLGQGGLAQGDLIDNFENVTGSGYDDLLYGDAAVNEIIGGAGSDLLDGRGGDDRLFGGDGDDTFTGGAGADLHDGGVGSDTSDYADADGAVQVSLAGGISTGSDAAGDTHLGIENLTGSIHADVLEGDGAANRLDGGRGDDILRGLGGDDTLIGGRGGDVLDGGDGIDTASYRMSATAVTVDMADGTAGGGDAEGDTFDGIEIVEGSFHDDTLRGGAGDNILRGGLGADVLDGRGGIDTADYTTSDAGVTVDLTGTGSAGDAAGDTYFGIENITGSQHDDTLTGDGGDNLLDGGYGADVLAGGAGSDGYRFGFDSLTDTIVENGPETDIDLLLMGAGVRPADVSLVLQDDDLLVELERDDGFTIDSVLLSGHMLGGATGIEEIRFEDGTVWNRALMDTLARTDRFNADDDVVRFADEDVAFTIDPALLFENDTEVPDETLTLVRLGNFVNSTAEIAADGTITFLSAPDFFGDAFFDYTVADSFGRESTATVEVTVLNVNDAPVAADDGVFHGIEDTPLLIPWADILGNDFDADSDTLSVTGYAPLKDADGYPVFFDLLMMGSNGRAQSSADGVIFTPWGDHFGFAGFEYTISDGNGASATAEVELDFLAINDGPRPGEDKFTTRMGRLLTIPVADLLANDDDPEGDPISFVDAFDAVNGTFEMRIASIDGVLQQLVDFTPDTDFLGTAGFSYRAQDDRGAPGTGAVKINVIPLNDPPTARNDSGFTTHEDQVLLINPGDLLANDTDPNDDPLSILSLDPFPENGRVEWTDTGLIAFTPRANYNGDASFTYAITDGRGGESTATVSLFIEPRNDAPVVRDDVIDGFEDLPLYLGAAEAFANDSDPQGDVLFFSEVQFLGFVGEITAERSEITHVIDRAALGLPATGALTVTGINGGGLPAWLTYDPASESLAGTPPQSYVGRVELEFLVTEGAPGAEIHSHAIETLVVDETIPFVTAEGAPLFDFDTEYSYGEIRVDVFDPDGPTGGIGVGDFLPDESEGRIRILGATAQMADGTALPDWLSLDTATLDILGTAPALYFDTLTVIVTLTEQNQTTGTLATRAIAVPIDLAPDYTFGGLPGFAMHADGDDMRITTPVDWFGAFALRYRAEDEKGGESANWATAVFNIAEQREVPVATDDGFVGRQGTVLRFTEADLLINDSDADGDGLRVESVLGGLLEAGPVALYADEISFEIPEDADDGLIAAFVSYEITAADGSPAPDWLRVEGETVRGLPPAGFDGSLDIVIRAVDGTGNSVETPATLTATPAGTLARGTPAGFTVDLPADLLDGLTAPTLTLDLPAEVESLPGWLSFDAATGRFTATPDDDATGPLLVTVTATEGDTVRQAEIAIDPARAFPIDFTPAGGFTGTLSFDYAVTDDRDGSDSATVSLEIRPGNSAPIAVDDSGLETLEDTALTIDPAELLANDTDLDGDSLRIVSVSDASGGIVELAGGQIVFTPTPDTHGTGHFTYTITDDISGSASARVSVTIIATNRAPVAVADLFTGVEDTTFTISPAALLANDFDPDGDAVSLLSVASEVAGGKVLIRPDGDISFTPDADLTGPVTFGYRIGDGRLVADGAVTISFAAVNDAPRPVNDTGTTPEDTPLLFDFAALMANDTDVEGDAFTIVGVTDPINGTVAIDGTTVVFTPRADYFGNGGFSYIVEDSGGAQARADVLLDVLPIPDAPRAVDDTGFGMNEDATLLLDPAGLLANDSDPDGGPVAFSGIVAATGGTATLTDTGLIRFEGAENHHGLGAVTYRIVDGEGLTATATAHIDIWARADAPVFTSTPTFEIAENATAVGLAAATDADGDALTFSLAGGLDAEFFTVDADGTIRFNAAPDFEAPADADGDNVYQLTLGVSDGATPVLQDIEITVTDVDEGGEPTVIEGTSGTDGLTGTDGDDLIVSNGGNDFVRGLGGNDTFAFSFESGDGRQVATIFDYTPGDSIDLGGTAVLAGHSFVPGMVMVVLDNADFDTVIVYGPDTLDEISFV